MRRAGSGPGPQAGTGSDTGPGLPVGWLLAAGLGLALLCLFHPSSVYLTPTRMDAYFGGEASPGAWSWPAGSWSWQDEPFRYRLLFHGLVDFVAEALALALPRSLGTYWLALLSVTAASVALALWAAERFLVAAGADAGTRLLLLGLWALMPPVHNAFVLPTQTKEDFLAYAILFLGLRAVLRGRPGEVLVWTLLGALTRETLMILPLAQILAGRGPLAAGLGSLAAGLAVHAALRLGLGAEGYTVLRDENFALPLLIPVALSSVFGFGWLALAPWLGPRALRAAAARLRGVLAGHRPGGDGVARLMPALPPLLLLVVAAHVLMARVVEMRISFLLVPWVLLALAPHAGRMRAIALSRAGMASLGGFAAVAAAAELSGLGTALRAAVFPEIGGLATRVWWAEAHLQLALAGLTLAAMLSPHGPRRRPTRPPA